MKNHSTFLQGLVDLSMKFQHINWGLINFLIEICLVLAGIVCACHYDPQLVAPLFLWVFVGFLIFLALIVITLFTSSLATRWHSAREEMLEDRIRYYQAQLKKVKKRIVK